MLAVSFILSMEKRKRERERKRGRDLLASTSAVREHMLQAVWLVPTKSWSPSPLSQISTPVTSVRTRRFPARQYRRGIRDKGGSKDNNWILCNNSNPGFLFFFFCLLEYRITRSRWFPKFLHHYLYFAIVL